MDSQHGAPCFGSGGAIFISKRMDAQDLCGSALGKLRAPAATHRRTDRLSMHCLYNLGEFYADFAICQRVAAKGARIDAIGDKRRLTIGRSWSG